ncbi:proteasome assembly chaperone 4-like [Liolophura sinensis]|uniref:proteasome assembly chaperone 4-like n=1 Tax=Liolophura sinensis TaxID=3198878 RepID=UPI00315917DA
MATKCKSSIKLHNFSARLTDTEVFFQVMQLSESFHLWVGTNKSLGSTAVAMNSPYEKMPVATHLHGDHADQSSVAMARRLAKKTGKQVFVSCNIAADQLLFPLVEKRIHEEMTKYPEYF